MYSSLISAVFVYIREMFLSFACIKVAVMPSSTETEQYQQLLCLFLAAANQWKFIIGIFIARYYHKSHIGSLDLVWCLSTLCDSQFQTGRFFYWLHDFEMGTIYNCCVPIALIIIIYYFIVWGVSWLNHIALANPISDHLFRLKCYN